MNLRWDVDSTFILTLLIWLLLQRCLEKKTAWDENDAPQACKGKKESDKQNIQFEASQLLRTVGEGKWAANMCTKLKHFQIFAIKVNRADELRDNKLGNMLNKNINQ